MNPELKGHFEEKGLQFVGQDVEGERMEIIQLEGEFITIASLKRTLLKRFNKSIRVELQRLQWPICGARNLYDSGCDVI